jgi:hypothetical protein
LFRTSGASAVCCFLSDSSWRSSGECVPERRRLPLISRGVSRIASGFCVNW